MVTIMAMVRRIKQSDTVSRRHFGQERPRPFCVPASADCFIGDKMKPCFKCKKAKPLSEFYRHPKGKDGHLNKCITCCLKDAKKYRETEQGRATQKKGQQRFRMRHPERLKAIAAVNNAVRDGKMPRPDTLQCHYGTHSAEQYHHWHGYKPKHYLDVIPACKKCHYKKHRKIA